MLLHGGPKAATLFTDERPHRSRHRNQSPSYQGRSRRDESPETMVPVNNLVMGKVKILKRGDPLTAFVGSKGSENRVDLDLGLGSTRRLGPDPSSLPVPCFLGKNGTATSDLQRLLRLNLPWNCDYTMTEWIHRCLLRCVGEVWCYWSESTVTASPLSFQVEGSFDFRWWRGETVADDEVHTCGAADYSSTGVSIFMVSSNSYQSPYKLNSSCVN